MLYGAVFLLTLGLLLFSLLECIATESSACRNLPKPMWILLIVLLPTAGSIAWLLLGRPQRTASYSRQPGVRPAPASRPRRPIGPDDDPRFLQSLSGPAGRSLPGEPAAGKSAPGETEAAKEPANQGSGDQQPGHENGQLQDGAPGTGSDEPGRNPEGRQEAD